MKLTLIYNPVDASTGVQLKQDLEQAGYTVSDQVQAGADTVLLVLLSSTAVDEKKLVQALDNHQHIIPILTAPVSLPRLIDNLPPLDFTQGKYPLLELLTRITALNDPAAPRPLTVLTPTKRKSNRNAALVILIPILMMFISGIILIGGGVVKYPQKEYDLKETQRVEQRNAIIQPTLDLLLPRTTQDALAFDSTIQAVPTRLQPFLAETATSFIVGSATPAPTGTDAPDPRS
jgi:hypothetical protein